MRKQHIINLLFISSFSFFGIGRYLSQVSNFSIGYFFSIIPLLAIVLFYLLELLYRRKPLPRLQTHYVWLVLLVIAFCWSFMTALRYDLPGLNSVNTTTLILYVIVSAHTALIVQLYNDPQDEKGSLANLVYWGLTLLVLLNLLGYAAGLQNAVHAIGGRISLPFAQGLYSIACSVAILNLLILGRILKGKPRGFVLILYIAQFSLNLILMAGFNSRLSMLTFVLVAGLLLTKLWRPYPIVYAVSLFTLPLLLGFSELIYEVVQLPVFSEIMQRVDYEDVTSFNGRRYLWESSIDWLLTQGEGWWWGNGYKGYYTVDLFPELNVSWGWGKEKIDIHQHSSMMSSLVANGVLGTLPLLVILWLCLKHYTHQYRHRLPNASLLGAMLYLLIILEIDNYVYVESMGLYLLLVLSADVMVNRRTPTVSQAAPPAEAYILQK